MHTDGKRYRMSRIEKERKRGRKRRGRERILNRGMGRGNKKKG